MIEAPEADVDVAPRPLSDEQIAKDRAAAPQQRQRLPPLPEAPMAAAEHEVIGQPGPAFNDMADKLEKALKGVLQQSPTAPEPKDEAPKTAEAKAVDPKAPQAPAEPAPEEKTITSAKAADWKAVKEKAAKFETEAKDYAQKHALVTKEYEEFKKKAVDMAKVEEVSKKATELQAERDTLKEQIKQVALERSDEFKSAYDSRFTEALSRAKDAVGPARGDQIESLMQLPPTKWRKEQLNAIREELDGVDQGQLDVSIRDYDVARKERESAITNSEATYKHLLGMQAEKANRVRELETHRITAAVESVLALARENYDSFKAGDKEEQKATVQANEERVRKFFKGQLDGHELAKLPLHAAEYERITKDVLPSMEKKIKELEATVAQYEASANPGPGGGGGGQSGAAGGKESDFISTFQRNWPDRR